MIRWARPLAFVILLTSLLLLSHRYGWGPALMETLPRLRELAASRPIEAALLYVFATAAGIFLRRRFVNVHEKHETQNH